MLIPLSVIVLCGSRLVVGQTNDVENENEPSIIRVYTGAPIVLWCNLTSHQDLSAGFAIHWFRDGFQWCGTYIALRNSTTGECVDRSISINNLYNPTGTQDFQLSVTNATLTDSGNHSCTFDITSTLTIIRLNTSTLVHVSEKPTTRPENKTASSPKNGASNSSPLSQPAIIGIGAGAGGGVLLVIIIIAVVCVKKKGKGNSTTGVNAKKANNRKSNPLEKNAENLHYADLTLHENPKPSSSTGTGSAKSKTLTLNPGDDRVEYAQVVKH